MSTELEDKINIAIAEIRPLLQGDGGDIELVAVEGTIVNVRLRGACHGCPHAAATIKGAVEARIRELAPEITEVIAVN
jgi:Fe-S cluster biogenesis protein NfuA